MGGQLVLGGYTEDMVEQYLLFGALWSVSVVGHSSGERGCYRCVWSFSYIGGLQSIPSHIIVHQLGENDR
jgi:hypothetical protein